VRAIAACALRDSKNGRASDHWRGQLEGIDRTACFSGSALRLFQDLQARLGLRTGRPILLPLSAQPFWHRMHHPFANYQSTASLPRAADVVIIGAGLTGAAAAHRLKDTGLKIVLLDQGDPAGEASGRNGGSFELLPENSVGTYEGLAPGRFAFMQQRYPQVPPEVLRAVSERQASLVLGLALRNRGILEETILGEGISCDFSPRGWLTRALKIGDHVLRRGARESALGAHQAAGAGVLCGARAGDCGGSERSNAGSVDREAQGCRASPR
jgi:hypothetical protein